MAPPRRMRGRGSATSAAAVAAVLARERRQERLQRILHQEDEQQAGAQHHTEHHLPSRTMSRRSLERSASIDAMNTASELVKRSQSGHSNVHINKKELQGTQRVLKALASGTETVNVHVLHDEAKFKRERSKRATVGFRFAGFFVFYVAAVVLQKNAWRAELVTNSAMDYFVGSAYPDRASSRTAVPAGFAEGGEFVGGLNGSSYVGINPNPPPIGCLPGDCADPSFEHKGFLDLVTLNDFWDWMQLHFLDLFYVSQHGDQPLEPWQTNTYVLKSRAISGFRWTMRRVKSGARTRNRIDARCWDYSSGDMRKFVTECYDRLALCVDALCVVDGIRSIENREPFGQFQNASKYHWEEHETGALFGKEKGFFVFFPDHDKEKAREMMEELKADRWMPLGNAPTSSKSSAHLRFSVDAKLISFSPNCRWLDKSSGWFRMDFTLLNPDENMFLVIQFLITFDNSGLLIPFVYTDVFPTLWYHFGNWLDVVRLVMEIWTLLFWVLHLVQFLYAMREDKQRNPDKSYWQIFRKSDHPKRTAVGEFQLVLFAVIFCLWLVLIGNPVQNNIAVEVDRIDWQGKPLFLLQYSDYTRCYWILNGVNCLLFIFRFLTFAKVNPRFSLLSESLELMKGRVLNFGLVLVILLIFFAIQAMMMFGDSIPGFTDFGFSLVEVFTLMLGGGGGSASRRSGGGSGKVTPVDYATIKESNPRTAWLFYYPFTFVIVFVVLNIVIAIISETYVRVKNSHDPNHEDYHGPPSEALNKAPVPIMRQLKKGFRSRMARCLGKERGAMDKADILEFCAALPEDFDRECAFQHEFEEALAEQNRPTESLEWLKNTYEFIVNDEHDLKLLLDERMPPLPTHAQVMNGIAASLEEIVSNQAANHAKLDLLIRMAAS